jgi:glycosyltransferase involved in cell wall biosynthesis
MKITIITPSFNQAAYLEETILSVLEQGYDNLEHIIIDGGSTDGSVDIIKKYERHLAYWVSEPDNGQSEALNKGFGKATGDVVTWLNSDDVLLPGAVKAVQKAFAESGPDVGVIYGGAVLFDDKKDIQTFFHTADPCAEAYLAGMIFAQPASFFRKSVLDKIGLINEDLHYGMDYDLFARMSLVTRFHFVPRTFAKYRLHYSSKTVTEFSRFVEDWKKVFVNLCKNLGWQEELEFLRTLRSYRHELAFYSPYAFAADRPLNSTAALFHHLCFLSYNSTASEADKEVDELLQKIHLHFPGNGIKTNGRSRCESILSPLYQSLFQRELSVAPAAM